MLRHEWHSVQPGCDVIKLKMFLGRRIQEKGVGGRGGGTRREYGREKFYKLKILTWCTQCSSQARGRGGRRGWEKG